MEVQVSSVFLPHSLACFLDFSRCFFFLEHCQLQKKHRSVIFHSAWSTLPVRAVWEEEGRGLIRSPHPPSPLPPSLAINIDNRHDDVFPTPPPLRPSFPPSRFVRPGQQQYVEVNIDMYTIPPPFPPSLFVRPVQQLYVEVYIKKTSSLEVVVCEHTHRSYTENWGK